ncbi:hypothetical protein PGT21_013669 [Puccinia graminis f. sp. tritici]|uniref:Argonaute linker 1 domain-containing protein n=1 Tax=Puccinia graminis f. sp. tritici TaxID=56615 RepID=A0A5B0LMJ8_PUCGR|nr:hypothetical protein PGT21_013669 [Puccinia graminis f. sp. tritici]
MVETQMVRPKAGTLGEKLKVTVNAYKVKVPGLVIHHYDVSLVNKHGTVGDVPPSLGREIFTALKAMDAFQQHSVVYDGRKTVFSPQALNFPHDKQTFDVNLASPAERVAKRNRSFKVVITKVNEVKLDNLLNYVKRQVGPTPDEGVYIAITALNVLFNHDMMMTHPNSKNKFFPRPQGVGSSGMLFKMKEGIEMWRGYFSSIRMAPGGVILNFDLTSQPMLTCGNLRDVAVAVLGVEPPGSLQRLLPTQLITLSRSLKMMTVSVSRVDKTILRTKIKEVAKSAREMIFEAPVSPDSKVMKKWNVAEYIEFTYNMKLKGANEPIVRLTGKGWYPLEICHVNPGQKFSKKLSPERLSDVIKWLTVGPQDRTRMLTNGIQNHLRTGTTIDRWTIELEANPLVISARQLAPPTVYYAPQSANKSNSSTDKFGNGAWNLSGKMLLQPVAVTSWVAIVLSQANFGISKAQAAQALEGLQSAMKAVGMQVSGLQGPAIFVDKNEPLLPSDDESVGKWIMSKIKRKPQLIVCFLGDKNAWEYRQV